MYPLSIRFAALAERRDRSPHAPARGGARAERDPRQLPPAACDSPAAAKGSRSRDVFRPVADRAGLTVEALLKASADATLLKRLPALDEVANVAAFLASDEASAMTGAIANLSCGALVD
jgi:NAD(P)-dependent dehydrogenase (short-subunit alcohol dehydrogenase family)